MTLHAAITKMGKNPYAMIALGAAFDNISPFYGKMLISVFGIVLGTLMSHHDTGRWASLHILWWEFVTNYKQAAKMG